MSANDQEDAKALCFVVGPIGNSGSEIRKHSDMLLHLIVRHILNEEEFGFEVKRADDDARPGMIGDRIIHDLINAQLVIADLTELNPNVFYELGIRHSTEKATIHIAKLGTKLPFDNQGHDTIFVDVTDYNSIEASRARLRSAVREVLKPNYKVSNPITQAQATFKFIASADPKERYLAELSDRISLLESYPRATPDTFAPYSGSTLPIPFLLDKINHEMMILFTSAGSKMSEYQFMTTAKNELYRLARLHNATIDEVEVSGDWIRYQMMGFDTKILKNGIYLVQPSA